MKVSAEDYLREALAVLDENADALTIDTLCARLDVTKGSFYHHFGGMAGFVEELVGYWEREQNEQLATMEPSLRAWVSFAVELRHGAEAAIRAWGRSTVAAGDAVARVDRRRERQIADRCVELGVDQSRARALARSAITLLVGAQQRWQPMDVRRLRQQLTEFNRLIALAAP